MSIIVTSLGDVVIGAPQWGRGSDDPYPLLDDKLLPSLFVHKTCTGFVDVLRTTPEWRVMLCRRCGLRVVLPQAVETVGDLREWSSHIPLERVQGDVLPSHGKVT